MKGIISVFGSSTPRPGSPAYEDAHTVGRLLAEAGFAVANGGYEGTMMAVSQGAAEAGGHVVGVVSGRIERFRRASVNPWVKELHRYDSLTDRVLHLVRKNDGMIVLPGGIGTLSEMALAWSFLQVGEINRRPLVLLGELWRQTIHLFSRPEHITDPHMELLHFADTPASAVSFVIAKHSESSSLRGPG